MMEHSEIIAALEHVAADHDCVRAPCAYCEAIAAVGTEITTRYVMKILKGDPSARERLSDILADLKRIPE